MQEGGPHLGAMCTAILHAAGLGLMQWKERGTPNKQGEGWGKVLLKPKALHEPVAGPNDANLDTPDEKHSNTYAVHTAYMHVRTLSTHTNTHTESYSCI